MQELQAMLEQVIEEQLTVVDNTGRSSACDLSATKEMFNISGQQSFDAKHNLFSDDDGISSNDETTMPASQLDIAKKHASPQAFVKMSQTDLIELESEIARLRNNLTQLAEENKGLILMQDCHVSQIAELNQSESTKDDELKELKQRVNHSDLMVKELVDARDRAREAEGALDVKTNELA